MQVSKITLRWRFVPMRENNVEVFLNTYRELEDGIKMRYNVNRREDGSSIYVLKEQKYFKQFKTQVDLYKDIRNLLSHEPKRRGDYPIIPTKGIIDGLEALKNRVTNPPRVNTIMVESRNVYSASVNDSVRTVINAMIKNVYTHIPILDDGKVIGVFSENTFLSLFENEELVMIDDNLKFNDATIQKLIPIDRHITESFRFVPRDTSVFEVEELFKKAADGGDRIGLIFVTQNGKQNERILGILTPWDLPSEE